MHFRSSLATNLSSRFPSNNQIHITTVDPIHTVRTSASYLQQKKPDNFHHAYFTSTANIVPPPVIRSSLRRHRSPQAKRGNRRCANRVLRPPTRTVRRRPGRTTNQGDAPAPGQIQTPQSLHTSPLELSMIARLASEPVSSSAMLSFRPPGMLSRGCVENHQRSLGTKAYFPCIIPFLL